MQQALRADSGRHAAPSTSRVSKFVAAGVAVIGAGAIAVNPVSPVLDDIKAQQRAIELAAIANPVVEYQNTITAALANLSALSAGTTVSSNALAGALGNPALYTELAEFVGGNALNPVPLLTQLANFQATYGTKIEQGTAASQAALQTALQNLPTVLQNTFDFLAAGEFVEAFSELDIYLLVQVLERPGRPLFPLLEIPGDFVAGLPGGQIPAAVLDSLLVGRASGLTRALLAPALSAALQTAIILDDVQDNLDAGDAEGALSDLINLPGKTLNAFVNGFDPSGEGIGSTWQGLLSDRGPADFFFVDLPNAIAAALTPPTTTVAGLTAPTNELTGAAATELPQPADSVTLTIEPAPEVKQEAPPTAELGVGAPSAEVVTTLPVTDEVAEGEIIEAEIIEGEVIEAEVIEGEVIPDTAAGTAATPVEKKTTSTFGKKTQEALKKAGDDFNKAVGNILKPKKKDTTKTESGTTAGTGDGKGADTSDDKGGDTGGDT